MIEARLRLACRIVVFTLVIMRTIACALLLLACFPARAQVTIELLLDQSQFLRDESVPVKVRVVNRSGQTLTLGDDPNWLTFHVANRNGRPVVQRSEPAVEGAFELESASAANRRVDLVPHFSLSEPGRYVVTATVRIEGWGQAIVSPAKDFDIIPGFKVWEQEFGLPAKEGIPEVRKYSLQQAKYMKQLLLYARLSDDRDGRVFRVQPLGPLVSFAKPEAQVDKGSKLHVLFQSGARSFYYVVVSPYGELLQRETHEFIGDSRPVLRSTEGGGFGVFGGGRRRSVTDLPTAPVEPSKTAATIP